MGCFSMGNAQKMELVMPHQNSKAEPMKKESTKNTKGKD